MLKERESNFEILRIIGIILIISFHLVYKSGYDFEYMNANLYLAKTFWIFGEIGVNLFIIITGYFMIQKQINPKKIILLIVETFFYNLLNVLLNYYFAGVPIKPLDVIFPVIYNKYWFITAYIVVYVLSPFFNKLISNMSKIEFQKLLLITIFLWSLIPTLFGLTQNSTETLLYYSRFIWFIIMYFVGAYIKLYDIKFLDTKGKSCIAFLIMLIIMSSSIVLIYIFRNFFNKIGTREYAYLWRPNNIFMMIFSISIFQIFAKTKIKRIKIVNIFASTTLGVYMLHDGCFNHYLWNNLFQTKIKLESTYSLFYIIGISLLIFVIGAIIDLIRQIIEKYTLKKMLELDVWKKIFLKFNTKTKIILENNL